MKNSTLELHPTAGELLPKLSRYTAMAGAGLAVTASQAGIVVWTPVANNVAEVLTRPGAAYVYFDFQSGQVSNSSFAGADFVLTARASSFGPTMSPINCNYAFINGFAGNLIQQSNFYPARLTFGALIDAAQSFATWSTLADTFSGLGNWGSGGQGYLGLQFDIGGNTHYGWADITIDNIQQPALPKITLNQFAYNDVAGQGILAGVPEPKSMVPMALLALGAAGFAKYRQRRSAAKN